jgi:copper chaperone CopZ
MEILTFELPAMYGDHHVIEVRQILLGLPGVHSVNASSCFQVVEVQYDPAQVNAQAISDALDSAGYLRELLIPVEMGEAATARTEGSYFRHTAAYEQTGRAVSFAQKVAFSGRALWPCPGMGIIEASMKDAEGE